MLQNHALISRLTSEHETLLKGLDHLKSLTRDVDAPQKPSDIDESLRLISALEALLSIHHKAEEEILFPALYKLAPLAQGGPRCGLFMMHLLIDNLGRSFVEKAKIWNIPVPALNRAVSEMVQTNSPLTIPIEEHRGGKIAFERLRTLFSQAREGHRESWREAVLLSLRLDQLLRLHIEKEDTCLFVMANLHIPAETQAELVQQLEPNPVEAEALRKQIHECHERKRGAI